MRREPVAQNGNSYLIENNNQLNMDTAANSSRAFCKLPKILFVDEDLRKMSLEAKVLYALMLDRLSLSIANGWYDSNGRPYIIYAHETVMDMLNVSTNPATNCMRELVENGLVERRTQGLGRPDILYVKDLLAGSHNLIVGVSDSESPEAHNLSPRVSENETQESQNMRPNKTDQSRTDHNKTKRSNSFTRGMVSRDDHRTAEEELAEILAEQGILYPQRPSDTQPSGEEGIIEQ